MNADENRLYFLDTTLRDGNQTQGVDFSTEDKRLIALELDRLGIDYVEAGWPGANPTDDELFAAPPKLSRARFTAFGMTRRPGRSTHNDPVLAALLQLDVSAAVLVGKSWDHHVQVALRSEPEENLRMIRESIAAAAARFDEAIFDAEHFFDGFKANPDFAMDTLRAAMEGGARWIVLCDTNGGTLPHEISAIVSEVTKEIPGTRLGIHAHNDTEAAVANSLAAVLAGVRMVHGTINGLGERCGNANLCSIIPTLALKPVFAERFTMGIDAEGLKHLRHVSRLVDELLNRAPDPHQPYVGQSAFAHKAGLHVSAIERDPTCYEHVDPTRFGNERHILASNQAGRSNVLARLRDAKIDIGPHPEPGDPKLQSLLETIKRKEFDGYSYDGAEASFELLAGRILGTPPDYFDIKRFRILDERRRNALGEAVTEVEATVFLTIGDDVFHEVAFSNNGPVHALDTAMRKPLNQVYPELKALHLADYKVRILNSGAGTGAVTRVMITSEAEGERWATVGVSENIINASVDALVDSLTYFLLKRRVTPAKGSVTVTRSASMANRLALPEESPVPQVAEYVQRIV